MQKYLNFEEKSKTVLLDKQNSGIFLDVEYAEAITKFMNDAEKKEAKTDDVSFHHKRR